ncbi:MAG TPA: hypothetical protein VL832_15085 [Puia sp.]|nr:hypothetical protein [Puia sp.]
MKSIKTASRLLIVLLTGAALITGCGGSDTNSSMKTSVDSVSAKGPAPDNNSANNPSSADTNYQKDSGRKISDSLRRP